jgi:hypothetical protein
MTFFPSFPVTVNAMGALRRPYNDSRRMNYCSSLRISAARHRWTNSVSRYSATCAKTQAFRDREIRSETGESLRTDTPHKSAPEVFRAPAKRADCTAKESRGGSFGFARPLLRC